MRPCARRRSVGDRVRSRQASAPRHLVELTIIELGLRADSASARRLARKTPRANPAVAPVAKEYFGCEPERFRLETADGRDWVNRTTNRYDTILLDAFLGDSSPSHLLTREAFDAMRRVLQPGGTLVINSFADFRPGRDFFAASLEKTLKAVFRSVRIHAANPADTGNVFFVASDLAELAILAPPDFGQVHPYWRETARAAFEDQTEANPRHGIVLTDDYNPVEFFDAANREAIRRGLARSMRSL